MQFDLLVPSQLLLFPWVSRLERRWRVCSFLTPDSINDFRDISAQWHNWEASAAVCVGKWEVKNLKQPCCQRRCRMKWYPKERQGLHGEVIIDWGGITFFFFFLFFSAIAIYTLASPKWHFCTGANCLSSALVSTEMLTRRPIFLAPQVVITFVPSNYLSHKVINDNNLDIKWAVPYSTLNSMSVVFLQPDKGFSAWKCVLILNSLMCFLKGKPGLSHYHSYQASTPW